MSLTRILKQKLLILAAASCPHTVVMAQAPEFDVLGIRFGMTLEQVRATVKANDPRLTVMETERWSGGGKFFPETPAVIGICPAPVGSRRECDFLGEGISLGIGQFTQKVHWIERKTNQFKSEELLQALTDKYKIDWTRANAKSQNNVKLSKQLVFEGTWQTLNVNWKYVAQKFVEYDTNRWECSGTRLKEECGTLVEIYLNASRVNGIRMLTAQLKAKDYSLMIQDSKLQQAALAKHEKEKTEKFESQIKGVAPKL